MNQISLVWKFIFCVILAICLTGCSDDISKEDQLAEALDEMQLAAENRKLGDLMEYVSKQYQDEDGRNWKDVRALAQLQFLRNKNLHTYKIIKNINLINENQAEIRLLVAIAGTPISDSDSLFNLRAEMMRFDITFAWQESWKVTSARWQSAQPQDF